MDDLRLRLAETSLGLVLGGPCWRGQPSPRRPIFRGPTGRPNIPESADRRRRRAAAHARRQGGLREEHGRPEERHRHRCGAQILRARRAAARSSDALSVRHHPGAARAGDDGARAQSPGPGGRARQADAERGGTHPVPVLQRPLGRPFRRRHARRGIRPASTRRRSSTRPVRRTPTRCGRPSASARSARRSSRTSSPSTIPSITRRIGRRASSTSSATTCASRTMSAASRTATYPG